MRVKTTFAIRFVISASILGLGAAGWQDRLREIETPVRSDCTINDESVVISSSFGEGNNLREIVLGESSVAIVHAKGKSFIPIQASDTLLFERVSGQYFILTINQTSKTISSDIFQASVQIT